VRSPSGEKTVTIVGVDEVDPAHGRVSWVSPIAKALLKAREGDQVTLRTPAGEEKLEIVEVTYQ
jgi:transcription elongation factor GreB